MNMEKGMARDFRQCVDFHGHVCGGLATGYRASKAAMDWLQEHRALDEELVAIVENDSCAVDAVQVLTGCTFGKGNFIYRDYGKMAFTFFSRKTGQGVRLSPVPRKGGGLTPEQKALYDRKSNGTIIPEELELLDSMGKNRALAILEMPLEQLFILSPTTVPLPEKARIEPSEPCSGCNELTMVTRLETRGNRKICRECLACLDGSGHPG